MNQSKTDKVIDILVEKTSHSRDEIKKMIQDTIIEMDNMVNEEGAAYVLANNLGIMINIGQQAETYTIDMLSPGQSNITILGRVSKVFGTRTFERKDNTTGKVRNIEIIDQTGEVRVALWDTKADAIEEKNIEKGSIVRISGANARLGYQDRIELSVGNQALIDPVNGADQSRYPQVSSAQMVQLNQLETMDDRSEVSVKGKIVRIRDSPTVFQKKDGSEGRVSSLRVTDGTGQVRITFWDAHVDKIAQFDVGDLIKVTDVVVGSSEYGKELTFRDYSTMTAIEDPELESIEIDTSSGRTTQVLESLKEVEDGARGITVTGQIISLGNINSFERDGETNYVANMTIRDNTQQRRVTLWREKAQKIDDFSIGDVVRIENASARFNDYSSEVEISVNDYSTITDITSEVDISDYDQEPEFVKLGDITETRRGVSLKVQVNRVFDTNVITRDDGSEAKVMNMEVYDTDGNRGRIAAWDDNIAKIDQYNDGDALILYNVSIKPSDGEYPPSISVNQYTKIEETELDDIMPMIQSASSYQNNPLNYVKSTLDNLTPNSSVEVQATVVKAYSPNFYNSCTQCNRKVDMAEIDEMGTCPVHGEVTPKTRMILSLVLDDNVSTITVKLFDKVAENLLDMTAEEAKDMIERLSDENAPIEKQKLEMKEIVVRGKVVEDDYSEQLVINASKVEYVDIAKQSDEFLSKFE